uniref:Nuclear pore complex protein Nup98-Nup96 n=1 Tax=Acrobeloides nanus TaxID=290746 RepID=A0A914BXW0_9BILA
MFGQQRSLFSTGASTTNLFGGGTAAPTGFSQQQQQPSMFSTGGFGASTVSGSTVKFDPVKGTDTMMRNNETKTISTKHMCMTAMKQYETKSLEELRVEDYLANRKAPAPGTSTLFSSQPSTGGTSLFGQSSGTSSLFSGAPKPAFGTASTAPSLFGQTATTTQAGSLFGPSKPAGFSFNSGTTFGAPATQQATGTSPFAAKPASLFGQTQPQQQASLFGTPAQQPAFGAPATTSNMFSFPSTAPITSNAFGPSTAPQGGFSFNQPAAAGGSLFGKPATSSAPFVGGFPSTSNAGFGTGGTSLFGAPANQKPGLFGAPQTTASLSLFGNTTTSTAPAFFGAPPQQPAAPSMFGNAAFQTGPQAVAAPMYQSPPAQPIVLGADVNEVALQQAIIDAQISSLPYGDSPLLKMSSTIAGDSLLSTDSPTNIQRQMRFLASKTAEKKGISTLTRDDSTLLNSPLASARLDTSRMSNTNVTFAYKPILSMPSLGFASASKTSLNSTGSPSKSFMSRADDSSVSSRLQSTKKSNVKVLDISVLRKPSVESPASLNETREENHHEIVLSPSSVPQTRVVPDRPAIGTPPVLNLDQSSSVFTELNESRVEHATITITSTNGRLTEVSPTITRTSETSSTNSKIVFSRPEYYVEPSLSALKEATVNGVCKINNGLTIGRLGYGSVFWPGSFELSNLNFDEIVHFRHKEVVVYPDESTKPEVGQELNQPAEVSLERVWPTDKQTRQSIKDPEELARMGFRERLERYCVQMDARFIDYQPATGTWCFAVSHFSKYGFVEESDDEGMGMTLEEMELLKQQRDKQFLVQRAKVPLRETAAQPLSGKSLAIEETLIHGKFPNGLGGDTLKFEKTELDADEFMETKIIVPKFEKTIDFFGKRIKLDEDLMDESKDWLQMSATCALRKYQSEKIKRKLIERPIVNRFEHAIAPTLSILSMLNFKHSKTDILHSNACKVQWAKGLTFVSGGFSPEVNVCRVDVVPLLESYIKQVLTEDGREEEYTRISESDLFRLNPPSTLLRLMDSYLVYLKSVDKNDASIDGRIQDLCRSLLIPEHPTAGVERRIRLGEWLKQELGPLCEEALANASGPWNPFLKIYVYLVYGRLQDAINFAKSCRLFHLQMFLSLYNANCSQTIRTQFAEQVRSYDRIYPEKKIDRYLEKVLLLLSGSCAYTHGRTQSVTSCVESLNWLQIFGTMIWYWSAPRTTLLDCINLYDSFLENQYIQHDQSYVQTLRF